MLKYYRYKTLRFFRLVSKEKYAKETAKYTMDYKLIASSKYFDKSWYLKQNPDVEKAGVDPVQHYLSKGWKDGRNPSYKFDGSAYLDFNLDVKRANINPLLHYETYGKKEGRKWNVLIKPSLYDRYVCKRKNKNPKISIIVASYNYQDFIKETLDSLLVQTYKNFEIIVVDDGSKDNSVNVIKEYIKKYDNIFLYQHENGTNKGLPATVKLGVEKSTGDYIAFCESDDYWTQEHLEEKVRVINTYANPKIIVNDVECFGDKERCIHVGTVVNHRRRIYKKNITKISFKKFRKNNYIVTFSCCMIEAKALKECNFDDNNRPSAMDWWLYRQLCLRNPIYYVYKKLTMWRMHKSFNTKVSKCFRNNHDLFLKKMDNILKKRKRLFRLNIHLK